MTTSTKGFKIGFRYLAFLELVTVDTLYKTVTDLSYSGTTVVLTSAEHGLEVGDEITVLGVDIGATVTDVDGTWTITAKDANTFTFEVAVGPTGDDSQTGLTLTDVVSHAVNLALPAATDPVLPYEGLHYESARALTINYPQPRKIEHQGDDRVEALDFLPPSTAMDAEVKVGMSNLDIIAALSGIKVAALGTSNLISLATDQQGLEPFVGILAYSQSLDWPVGDRTWSFYAFPYARAIYAPSSFAETPQDILFRVAPQFNSHLPWGQPLDSTLNGTLTHQGLQGIAQGRPHMVSWLANGIVSSFLFNPAHPAYDAGSVSVFVNGIPKTCSATLVTGFTPTVLPEDGDIVTAWYEE
jgi:hypothetical protein